MGKTHALLEQPRGQGFTTALCSCGWTTVTRAPRTAHQTHLYREVTPDLPPNPTGRGWSLPSHLAARRIF